jgi:hypothetical protein
MHPSYFYYILADIKMYKFRLISNGQKCISSCVKIGHVVQKLKGEKCARGSTQTRKHTHTHTERYNNISLFLKVRDDIIVTKLFIF